uniref:Uncharacterized protein n=1 Tax=Plectus sambesii TaxID=2011161 RepID=A0A914XI49_9BILA
MHMTAAGRKEDRGLTLASDLVNKYCKTSDLILIAGANNESEVKLLTDMGYQHVNGVGVVEAHNFVRSRRHFDDDHLDPPEPSLSSLFESSRYDAVVCIGCFVPGALDQRHVDDLLGTLKPGGISIIGTREMFMSDPGEPFNYPYNLQAKLEKLQLSEKLTLLEHAALTPSRYLLTDRTPPLTVGGPLVTAR